MKSKLLLRIAAVIIFIHSFLHMIGHAGWKQATDPVAHQVIAQMTGHKFPFMGVDRSIANYYDGYGYACGIALFLIAAILFILAGNLSLENGLAAKIILSIWITLLFWAADEWLFFFPFAAALTFIAGICCMGAYFLLRKANKSVKIQ